MLIRRASASIETANAFQGAEDLDRPEQGVKSTGLHGLVDQIRPRPPLGPQEPIRFTQVFEEVTDAVRLVRPKPPPKILEGLEKLPPMGLVRAHRDLDSP